MHRIIVIGRGMFGSAAGRHLAELTDGVAVVGPGEPEDRSRHNGVFGSHYDEGRMTRIIDPNPAWSITAKRSIERYQALEIRSGIPFFTKSGYLGFGRPDAQYLLSSEQSGHAHEATMTRLDATGIRARFPFLSVADDVVGLQEVGTAGHISPRAFVRAQTEVARQDGASIIDDEAVAVRLASKGVDVTTKSNGTLHADRVLIAAGAFTDACELLPFRLGLKVLGRTVVLARVDGAMLAALSGMPTMGQAESGAYILPPIRYPDGHHYLKIGIGTAKDEQLHTRSDLARWFKSAGSDDDFRDFKLFITALIPLLKQSRHWHTDSCAVTQTATALPYIDFAVEQRLAVMVGGNGKGAKSADDWGWLAARMMTNHDWDHPVARERLRLS